ncbi:MAG: hypothetical protein RBU21_01290 [FCB group bacterium]|nr:hypothetical protein [FCB group bacterium]
MSRSTALTRRTFLGVAVSAAALATVGCPRPSSGQGVKVYIRSGRGKRVSNAAKSHNHNHLYATRAAALANPAHPGDKSKVVSVVISQARYDRLFAGNRVAVDLREIR